MRMRNLRPAPDRLASDPAATGPRTPRLRDVAAPADAPPRIELVAGERIAVVSDESAAPMSFDKGILLKAGFGVVGALALVGAFGLVERLLGL